MSHLYLDKIKLPLTSERICGVTLPENGHIYVIDYDEVHQISLGDSPTAKVLDDEPYHFHAELAHSLGIYNNEPILTSGANKISYKFDPHADSICVSLYIKGEKGEIEFRTLSGDWFQASFSRCGEYLLLAEPYDFDLYKIK